MAVDEVYFEGFEESLVQAALGRVRTGFVELGSVLQRHEYCFESFEKQEAIVFGGAEKVSGVRYFALDFELARLDGLSGEGVIEVGVDELLLESA